MSARNVYIVAYDICDPARLRRVHRTMRGFGDGIQLSVFRCHLSDRERVQLIAALEPIIHHKEDQVLIIPLGPPTGKHATGWTVLGAPLTHPPRAAVII